MALTLRSPSEADVRAFPFPVPAVDSGVSALPGLTSDRRSGPLTSPLSAFRDRLCGFHNRPDGVWRVELRVSITRLSQATHTSILGASAHTRHRQPSSHAGTDYRATLDRGTHSYGSPPCALTHGLVVPSHTDAAWCHCHDLAKYHIYAGTQHTRAKQRGEARQTSCNHDSNRRCHLDCAARLSR